MQQATTEKPPNPSASMQSPARAVASQKSRFVINLCSSTSPVALARPDHAGLKRFTFFVSRRREEGRERFRLHMGYFESQEEAEQLLDIVREIYPGAWAGLAPGQKLRAKAEAEAAAAAPAEPGSAGASTAVAPKVVPPAQPEPVAAAAPPAAVEPERAPVPAAATFVPVRAVAAPPASPPPPAELTLVEPEPPVAAQPPTLSAKAREDEDTAIALSNVRAAIASLEDSHADAPTVSPIPELKAASRGSMATAAREPGELNDSGVLKVLENRDPNDVTVSQPLPRMPAAAMAGAATEKTQYAVQLMWSVQPIDIAQIPQLAIFSAYTLYGAEGNRDGRRWYGVRLGFFTDAVSAKQVAHYVRSDFATVSVVPVTVRERERAMEADPRPAVGPVPAQQPAEAQAGTAAATPPAAPAPAATSRAGAPAFEFIEDRAPQSPPSAPTVRASRGAPGKRAKARTPRPATARGARNKPMTLEETLEILGAGELKVDEGRRASINDGLGKVPEPEESKSKTSRFGRLLERLSGITS